MDGADVMVSNYLCYFSEGPSNGILMQVLFGVSRMKFKNEMNNLFFIVEESMKYSREEVKI